MDNSNKLKLLNAIGNGLSQFITFLKNMKPLKDESGEKMNKLVLVRIILQIVLQILLIGTSIAVTIQQTGDNETTGDNPERNTENENS